MYSILVKKHTFHFVPRVLMLIFVSTEAAALEHAEGGFEMLHGIVEN